MKTESNFRNHFTYIFIQMIAREAEIFQLYTKNDLCKTMLIYMFWDYQ